jgi:hypothetical protein
MLLMPWRSWVGPDRLRYSQRRLASALRVVLGLYWTLQDAPVANLSPLFRLLAPCTWGNGQCGTAIPFALVPYPHRTFYGSPGLLNLRSSCHENGCRNEDTSCS